MRARQGLANILWELGRREEALEHYWDMLRLNPGDNQGIRYILLPILLTLDQDQEAHQLLIQYADDQTAMWLYSRALLTFRENGVTPKAKTDLKIAMDYNPNVLDFLTGRKRIPIQLPNYIGIGDEDEAVVYAADNLSIWRRTPGAIEWLKQTAAGRKDQISSRKPTARARKQSGKGKKRGKS